MHSHNDRSCTSEAIGGNHFGPVIVYMAKVADATTASPSGLSWFKVDEEGYDAATKVWGTDSLNKNCGKREFTVPSKIPAGDYLVRAEAIALHAAGQVGGAQFYMTCYVSLFRGLVASLVWVADENKIASQGCGWQWWAASCWCCDPGGV